MNEDLDDCYMRNELLKPFRNPIYGNEGESLYQPEPMKTKEPRDYLKKAVKFALKDSVKAIKKAVCNFKPTNFEFTVNPKNDKIHSWYSCSPSQISYEMLQDIFRGYNTSQYLSDFNINAPSPLMLDSNQQENNKPQPPLEIIEKANKIFETGINARL